MISQLLLLLFFHRFSLFSLLISTCFWTLSSLFMFKTRCRFLFMFSLACNWRSIVK